MDIRLYVISITAVEQPGSVLPSERVLYQMNPLHITKQNPVSREMSVQSSLSFRLQHDMCELHGPVDSGRTGGTMRHTKDSFENRTEKPDNRKLIWIVILLLIQMLLVFEALVRRWNVSAACLFHIALAGHIRRARLDSKYRAAKPLFYATGFVLAVLAFLYPDWYPYSAYVCLASIACALWMVGTADQL